MNRATCQSVLMSLEEGAFVRRDPRRKTYSLGPALIPLGEAALASLRVVEEARPEVDRLAADTGVECVAAVAAGAEMIIVARAGPPIGFGALTRVGQTVPICPPFGIAFVAWSDSDAIDAWLARAGKLPDPERKRYLASIEVVRQRGYSVTLEIRSRERLAEVLGQLRSHRQRGGPVVAEHQQINQLLHEEYLLPEGEEPGSHRLAQLSVPVFGPDRAVALVLGLSNFPHDLTSDEVDALRRTPPGHRGAHHRTPARRPALTSHAAREHDAARLWGWTEHFSPEDQAALGWAFGSALAVGSGRCASVCNGASDDRRRPGRHPTRVGSGRTAGPRTACPSRRRRVPRRDFGDRGVVRRRSVRPGDRAGIRAVSATPDGIRPGRTSTWPGPTSASPTPTSSAPRFRSCSLARAAATWWRSDVSAATAAPVPPWRASRCSPACPPTARSTGSARTTARTRSRPTSNARSSSSFGRCAQSTSQTAGMRRRHPERQPGDVRSGLVGVEAHVREQVERAVEQHIELGTREVDAETAVDAEPEADVAVGPLAEDVERLRARSPTARGRDSRHRCSPPPGNPRRRRPRRRSCRHWRRAAPTPAAARCGASPRSRAAPTSGRRAPSPVARGARAA